MQENNFAMWHGINRSSIEWHPVVDEKRCVGCGLCVVTCSEKRNVFGYNLESKKAVVLYPENCMVGCDNCRVACLWNAISFPDSSQLRQLADYLTSSGKISEELKQKINAGH
ncbi:MAG: 4Fe-4S dicluster domain-containing protein [Nitrososphaeria archaeon]